MKTEEKIIELATLDATWAFGQALGEAAGPGEVITLEGGLGAGKTTLTQAIGHGLGVPDSCYITSPTFSILHEYPGRIALYHLDLYRIGGEDELEALGLEEYLYGQGLTVVEWPEKLGRLAPAERLHIRLEIVGETARLAHVNLFGTSWQQRIAALTTGGQ